MYKVIVEFADLQDDKHRYRVGDEFPRAGFEVSKDRLEELSSINNRRHTPLIEKIEDTKQSVDDKEEANVTEVAEATENTPSKKKRTKKNAE